MKKILKVMYICFGAVICFLVYVLAYQTGRSDNLVSLTEKALASETNDEVVKEICKIFTSSFYSELDESFDNGNVKGGMVESASVNSYELYTADGDTYTKSSQGEELDDCYIMILYGFNDFGTANLDTYSNSFGLKFTSANNTTYTYYFVADSSVNSSFYTQYPTNVKDATLKTERSVSAYIEQYKFLPLIISKTMINYIKLELGMAVTESFTKVELTDSRGESKYSFKNKFEFQGPFFDAVSGVIEKFNAYSTAYYDSNSTDELKNAAKEAYEAENEKFQKIITADGSKYEVQYNSDITSPSWIVWRSIGICALFVLCGAILYMLFFHFSLIKRLVTSRGSSAPQNNYDKDSSFKKSNNKKNDASKKPSQELKFDVIDIKDEATEPVAEATVTEEVVAAEPVIDTTVAEEAVADAEASEETK